MKRNLELYGSLSYIYSEEEWSSFSDVRKHDISLRPGIGIFISPEWQVLIEPQYSLHILDYHSTFGISFGNPETNSTQWVHDFGLITGPSFNYAVSDEMVLFLAAKAGVVWSYFGGEPPFMRSGSPWAKPAVSFPIVAAGTKFFISKNWALLVQAEYSRTSNYAGYFGPRSAVSIAIGLSAFL